MKSIRLILPGLALVVASAQAANAQNASIDATADVVKAQAEITISGNSASFGTVEIPNKVSANEVVNCGYFVEMQAPDQNASTTMFWDDLAGASHVGGVMSVATNSGFVAPDARCKRSGAAVAPIFTLSCEPNAPLNFTLSSTPDAGAQYNGVQFQARNVDSNGTLAVPAAQTTTCSGGGVKYYTPQMSIAVDGDTQPYTGTVGTIIADVSY